MRFLAFHVSENILAMMSNTYTSVDSAQIDRLLIQTIIKTIAFIRNFEFFYFIRYTKWSQSVQFLKNLHKEMDFSIGDCCRSDAEPGQY